MMGWPAAFMATVSWRGASRLAWRRAARSSLRPSTVTEITGPSIASAARPARPRPGAPREAVQGPPHEERGPLLVPQANAAPEAGGAHPDLAFERDPVGDAAEQSLVDLALDGGAVHELEPDVQPGHVGSLLVVGLGM